MKKQLITALLLSNCMLFSNCKKGMDNAPTGNSSPHLLTANGTTNLATALLWDGNATKSSSSVWSNINIEGTGTVTAVTDPLGGKDWKFYKPAGSHRTEGHGAQGFTAVEGDDIYIGWRSKLIMPQSASTFAVFQWKAYGNTQTQNHPIMLRTTNGSLVFRDYSPGDVPHTDWSVPLVTGVWNRYVVRIKVSKDITKGFIEFWYNGVQQTFNNGGTRVICRTLDGDNCDPKWGIYGDDGDACTNYVAELRIATTYAAAAPQQ
ncbi:polysaccharide lyase-like protein [Chitinophaga niastensis]|uniref:Polysaccharide lyase-like protein n=1 Tax=Chitinophaga niastensis TaxID=536980 RepID=A0A2P8HGK8_CHINA|nr:heparin lyase I family protein [Chitinophaga niastensis]PSL45344.1 polysaccharide lyase-like protein [Chitinophaga niastensis]